MEKRFEAPKRDTRALVTLRGHPVHAALTDFPVVLFLFSFAAQVVAMISEDRAWWTVSYWTLLAALIVTVPTAVTGALDFIKLLRRRHPAVRTGLFHLATNGAASGLFLVAFLLRNGPLPVEGRMRLWTFTLGLAGSALIVAGGWFGGKMVYRHGVGVQG